MKIISFEEAKLHNTAVALGKFQGLHKGHMLLIEKITELSKKEDLTSGVFTINIDSSKAINLPRERFDILEEQGVDIDIECEFTPEFSSMQPVDFIKNVLVDKLGAKYVVVGTDFCFGYKRQGNVETLQKYSKEYGYEVIPVDKLYIDGRVISSSYIRELIETGNINNISAYMGRDYFISDIVSHGKELGRTMGFPTINFIPDKGKLLPPVGAYETEIFIDGRLYKGITNIGDNPTISSDNKTTVETHILDYDGDLYGRELKVSFKRFLRPQIKFNSVEELKKQLLIDCRKVMHQ